MSNTIQLSCMTATYSTPTKACETKQAGTQGSSFLDLAAQASGRRTDTLATAMSSITGMAALPTSLMMDLSVRSAGQVQTAGAEAVEAPSLETMLKAKYPNLVYLFPLLAHGRVSTARERQMCRSYERTQIS